MLRNRALLRYRVMFRHDVEDIADIAAAFLSRNAVVLTALCAVLLVVLSR